MTQFKRLRESEWEKNLAKKYKITNQLSARFSSKINDMINCHNDDDDSYAKNKMTIDNVNYDCLAEIFMYVPACERPKIALVCKQWKKVLDYYSWFNVKKLELTHWEYDEYPNYLIKHYPTIDGQFNFLILLLDNCGRYLTELDLTAFGHCFIVPVINESCPNLVKLRIRIKYIDVILDDAFTGLSKLKVLKIIFQCFLNRHSYVPVTLINSLLNVADTLTELNLSNWSGRMLDNANFPEEFTRVVSELKALKSIQIGGINCPKSLTDHLLSRSPGVIAHYDECNYQVNKIDSARIFENVEKLFIKKRRVTDDFLYNLANTMRHLRVLHIYGHEITDAGIVAISKMNHLRILDCYGYNNNVTDSSIKLLKNMLVLALPFTKKITDKSAIKVVENSPELKRFGVLHTGVTSELIKKADEISRNRKKQLTLLMADGVDIPSANIEYEYLTVSYLIKKKNDKTKIR